MAVTTDPFAVWLDQAQINPQRLSAEQHALLQAAFRFRQRQGDDYYSTRLLGHFLLHCASGLKVAQLARLLGVSRPTASGQQKLSSKQAVQQAHHRMDGRPYGKLLPRYAGPIIGFLLAHPDASRADLIDFIDATFAVRVSRIALYKFLKKFGLDALGAAAKAPATTAPAPPDALGPVPIPPAPATLPAPIPAPPFSSRTRSTPVRF
jgi:hypothetical protein